MKLVGSILRMQQRLAPDSDLGAVVLVGTGAYRDICEEVDVAEGAVHSINIGNMPVIRSLHVSARAIYVGICIQG